MTDAYPLRWPKGWPRTVSRKDSRYAFKVQVHRDRELSYRGSVPVSFDVARKKLCDELDRLQARNVVISTNIPLRSDGMPRSDAARGRFDDPGVAIYFNLKGRAMVMAQDSYDAPSANIRSLGLAIEAMRQLERHGGGTMMSKAFDGFAALPPPAGSKPKRPWWDVLRYSADPGDREFLSVAEIEARYRSLSKKAHPDAGGSDEVMAELSNARDEAVAELEGA